ncbi:MAG TPA: GTP-binding protein [Candidatus Lokiarchaeia archaeon]|nr:GTP-binding protein [Candidatus Lokiarchaeia archaeon]
MYPLSFKILLAGDEAVGKTSLVRRFVDKRFMESYLPTLGFEISVKAIELDGIPMIFSIWDIGGQQCFEPIRHSYYEGSHGFLLVFSVANRVTFANLENWIIDIHNTCPHAPTVILANKADLEPWKVTPEEIDIECKKLGAAGFIATSAKTGDGVAEGFSVLGQAILQNIGLERSENLRDPQPLDDGGASRTRSLSTAYNPH